MTLPDTSLLSITADIVGAHVGNNVVAVSELPALIEKVYAALTGLGAPVPASIEKQEPAVAVRASIKPDYLVCLEDGKKFKVLKRHLMTDHQLTPDAYRAKWHLPNDYPIVAPAYREHRQTQALKIGLGKKSLKAEPTPDAEATPEVEMSVPPAASPVPARVRRAKLKLAL